MAFLPIRYGGRSGGGGGACHSQHSGSGCDRSSDTGSSSVVSGSVVSR